MPSHYDCYYLEHVIDLSETEKVVFVEDVFTDKSVKLLGAGTVFRPRLYDLLRHHTLQKPLDDLIQVLHPIRIADVTARAMLLEQRTPYLRILDQSIDPPGLLINALSRAGFNGVLANKLTVMQKRLPDLYDHSIQTAMVAAAIGRELRLPMPVLPMLAMAGLLHDLGELHVDPLLLNAAAKFTEKEWQQIYAHPLVGYSLANPDANLPVSVARAVLEHHERMDGSGYPHNTPGAKLSQAGRILAAADVLTAIFQREPLHHVSTVFKAYVSNLDPVAVQAVNHLLQRMQSQAEPLTAPDAAAVDMTELSRLCHTTSRIMRAWKKLSPMLEDNPLEPVRRLQTRLSQIQIALLNAGIDAEDCGTSLQCFADDALSLQEVSSLLRELSYQFNAIVNETQRGWNVETEKKSATTLAVEKWLQQTQRWLAGAGMLAEPVAAG